MQEKTFANVDEAIDITYLTLLNILQVYLGSVKYIRA